MNLPLPSNLKALIKNPPVDCAPNLSLRFYKWADIYNHDFTDTDKDGKPKYLQNITSLSKSKEYVKAFAIRQEALDKKMGGLTFVLTTASCLLLGTGYSHPLGNGFLFDWTTGLPIIPGSSLKGVASTMAKSLSESTCPKLLFKEIFGDTASSGDIIFLPAYPINISEKPFLCQDVLTPHYAAYYRNPEAVAPADYHSPGPISFLAIPAGIEYRFRVLNRKNWRDVKSDAIKGARDILQQALKEEGVGAKTAVFYGYFK